jgi:hypothetical protein
LSEGEHEISELVDLWPISIEIGEQELFSLWGEGGGEQDLVLARDDRLIVAGSLADLYAHVAHEVTNIRALPTYPGLEEALRNESWPTQYIYARYSFDRILDPRNLDVGSWSREQANEMLNALNLLWDIANSIDDRDLTASLRAGGGPMANLADYLTAAEGLLAFERPSGEEIVDRIQSTFMSDAVLAALPQFETAVRTIFGSCIRW